METALAQESSVNVDSTMCRQKLLDGQRIALVGKLAGMSRREAENLIRDRGGQVVAIADAETHVMVVGDDSADALRQISDPKRLDEETRAAWREGRLQILREAEFWGRLGLVESDQGIQHFYTPVMLAELVHVPVRAIRHWHRKGHLRATRSVGRLPYFDFEEVRVAGRLAELFSTKSSLARIDRKLEEFARLLPDRLRPLTDAAVVISGSRLYVRRGESLTEPSGQLLLDFDAPQDPSDNDHELDAPATIPLLSADAHPSTDLPDPGYLASTSAADDLRSLADELEEEGESAQAIELFRAILMSGQATAEDHFFLAELLYRSGDLAAARERYYSAIELDEDYVEARANLGCVLAEQGEAELAEAAFRGALEFHAEFADAHYHLARLLDALDRPLEASQHWQRFLNLAPASPWAEEALDRTAEQSSP